MHELQNLNFEVLKRDKLIKTLSEENNTIKKLNNDMKSLYLKIREESSNKDNLISDLREKIGQLQEDMEVI